MNAKDQVTRLNELYQHDKRVNRVTEIKVEIKPEKGEVSIYNNGDGIDVAKHPEHKMWIPEMIFGHLRTSTNYKKDEDKIVGGKNGFGFKLVFLQIPCGMINFFNHGCFQRVIF